jgi:hypothetical protein
MKYTDSNGIEYTHTGKGDFGGIPHVSVSFYNPFTKEGGTGWIPTALWIGLTCPPIPR